MIGRTWRRKQRQIEEVGSADDIKVSGGVDCHAICRSCRWIRNRCGARDESSPQHRLSGWVEFRHIGIASILRALEVGAANKVARAGFSSDISIAGTIDGDSISGIGLAAAQECGIGERWIDN